VRAGLDRPGVNEMVDSLIASALRANAPIQVINDPAGHYALEMHDDTDVTRAVIDQTLHFVIDATDPRLQASLRTGIPEVHAAGAMINGDYATAVALYADLVAVRPDDATLRLAYGEALLGAGRAHDARAQFDRLKDAGLGKRDLGLPAAAAAMVDGDADAAIAWLKTIPMRFLPGDLATDPTFASLHGRADFQALFK
jgi:predicted Zn-dependent protease